MDINGRNFIRFLDRKKKYENQNSVKVAEKQHNKGKLTASERINILFDHDTFEEIDAFELWCGTTKKFKRRSCYRL